jgi:hypothetical protein
VLLGQFAGGVGAARVQRGVLGHQERFQGGAAAGARWFVVARVDRLLLARGGADDVVHGAAVAALAVDDHRRRQDEPADLGLVHGGQQHGGAVVVVERVERRVRRVQAVADDGGLVADRVHAAEQAGDGRRVAHVADDHLVAVGPGRGRAAVGLRQEGVEQHRLITSGCQRVGDVGSDETGSAGEENSHVIDIRAPGSATPAPGATRHGTVRSVHWLRLSAWNAARSASAAPSS